MKRKAHAVAIGKRMPFGRNLQYSMCQSKFERMAREAKATYKLDKLVLVNTELFEKYLETFRIVE